MRHSTTWDGHSEVERARRGGGAVEPRREAKRVEIEDFRFLEDEDLWGTDPLPVGPVLHRYGDRGVVRLVQKLAGISLFTAKVLFTADFLS